jgi:hypothetical protein
LLSFSRCFIILFTLFDSICSSRCFILLFTLPYFFLCCSTFLFTLLLLGFPLRATLLSSSHC